MLRPYQTELMANVRQAMRTHSHVLAVLPTGGGKTRIFCEIAKSARARGARVQVLVHRRELVDQTPDESVRTIQSWKPDGEDLVIVDEAHHSCARTWLQKLNTCDRVLGFTATPQRLDGGGLDVLYSAMATGPSSAQLIDDGWLSEYKLFCPPGAAGLKGIRRVAGDYNKRQLTEAVSQTRVVAAAVRNWLTLAGRRQTIGFCVSIAHMEKVQASFKSAGISCASIDGKMSKSSRDDTIKRFRLQQITVLLSVDLISEGFDVPACDCVLLLRPTQSLGLHLQQVGRALRPSSQHAVILDAAGNSEHHGLPDDARSWSLEGRQKRRAGLVANLAVRICPRCFGVHRPHLQTCPFCQYRYPLDSRIPEERDILLQEKEQKRKELRKEIGRARSIEQLEQIRKERGYRPGWVEHILRNRHTRTWNH